MSAELVSGSNVMAVVKANCYSNGLQIATFIEEYVCGFAVATPLEGKRLREIGIKKPILSLSFGRLDSEICKKYDIMASLSNPYNYVQGIKYHIAIDSGMNRTGVKGEENLISLLKIMDTRDICGVYSHIYSANKINVLSQVSVFEKAVDIVKYFKREIDVHLFATNYKHCTEFLQTDYVRLGIGLYDNAIAVTSNILQIKDIKKGESVGYDGEFVADKPMQIALCEGGYFDGIIRRFKGQNMGFNTDFCKVIGKISMDSHIVDITGKDAKIGDKIIVYDTDNLSFDRRAESMNISAYELMTALKGRFEYVYFN